jgi:hypothetical protein
MTLKKYVKVFKSRKPAWDLYKAMFNSFYDYNIEPQAGYEPKFDMTFIDLGDRRRYRRERTTRYTVTYWKPSRQVKKQTLHEFEIYKESAVEVRKFFKDNHQDYIAVIKSIKPTGKTIGRQKQYKIIYTLKSKKA